MRMINNALTGTQAAQVALNTASQNIANLKTPGYSRQGVVFATQLPGTGDPNSAGYGVNVAEVRRFSDDYKNLLQWQAGSQLGEQSAARPYFSQLEQVMGSQGSSLSVGFDKFFAALNAASLDSNTMRDQVVREAGALAQRFNNLHGVLTSQLAAIAEQRNATLTQMNSAAANLGKLNEKLIAARAQGINTSGLEDERDRQIDQLASLVEVRVVAQPDGGKNVTLTNGLPLVAGDSVATLSSETQPDGSQQLKLAFGTEKYTMQGGQLGGQLGGLNQFETDMLRPVIDQVRTLAGELANKVNTQLAKGFDMKGQPGKPLFVFDAGAAHGLLQTTGLQAADLGFSGDKDKPGNNDNLQQLIALKQQTLPLAGIGQVTLGDAYSQMIGHLAIASQQNKSALDTSGVIRAEAEKNWQSSAGVNRDEEAVNLIEFQKMFQANMKVISVANQLFESTLAIL
ncbi:flagellar hook-associated protein FlgK [Chromobacterium sp. IIBBL 290-4]|uniref:flagellar hook-associated protein FlgK n=1 Tax=Chromobacterium sp. IIBBL 290-4 TaxID=2953890 RepID=UPI0020B7EC32|nr:flagellar hook-associated protein FlgK [Chromobacterium sp. IIBBL 290-4]UTH72874.1 flagellar hook-associated protein FlgK [Chromobacterium sp. IIBBL 290-4]